VTVEFRGRLACECQAEWIPAYEHELQRRGIITGLIPIAQLIGGAPQSGGTHVSGGASDFWLLGDVADRAVWVARQMGADPTWHRLPGWDPSDPSGGSEHVHSVLRGCPHLSPSAAAQVGAVDANGDGLGGTTIPDPGPRPLSGRTWREGIAWALEQEDDMPAPKDWDDEDWQAIRANLIPEMARAVWAYVVRKATNTQPEQTAEAALKKAANR
jgi:hypothetical protein